MSKIVWDEIGKRFYETGVEKGVLYPFANDAYGAGVPWNGLINVTQKPSGAEPEALYADNIKYLNLMSNEDFGASIEAYTYPKEFRACDGSAQLAKGVIVGQQKRSLFGFSYVTKVGNDTDGADHGYKIHLVYGAQASPSEKAYGTVNETPEAITFSWEVSTTPVAVPGMKPSAHIEIDSTECDAEELAALETILYGSESEEPRLPLPEELATIFNAA